MKYLLGLAVLMAPLSTFAAEDLTISLSDVKEDTHNSEYLSFDVVELEFLVNRHAIEIAVNPINQDIYIELDFLALKESQKDQKIDNTNAFIATISLVLLGGLVYWSLTPEGLSRLGNDTRDRRVMVEIKKDELVCNQSLTECKRF